MGSFAYRDKKLSVSLLLRFFVRHFGRGEAHFLSIMKFAVNVKTLPAFDL
jgi:hypothetical protein